MLFIYLQQSLDEIQELEVLVRCVARLVSSSSVWPYHTTKGRIQWRRSVIMIMKAFDGKV